jgi:hypothetical protein
MLDTILEEPTFLFLEHHFTLLREPTPELIHDSFEQVLTESLQDTIYLLTPKRTPLVPTIPPHWAKALEAIQETLESPDPYWNTQYPPRGNPKYFYEIPGIWKGQP